MLKQKWRNGQGVCFFCEKEKGQFYFMVEITGKTQYDRPIMVCIDCFGNATKFKHMQNRSTVYGFSYEGFDYYRGKLYTEKEMKEILDNEKKIDHE